MCASLHVLWSLVYIGCGAIQLVVGIFFLVALPYLRLGSNIWAGGWNVVAGVSGALVACVGPLSLSSPGRHEALLYLAVSVMAANAINLALLEVVEWRVLMTEELRQYEHAHNLTEFLLYARLSTSAACVVAMAVGFLDVQLTFCSLQHAERAEQASRRRISRRSGRGSSKTGQHDHGGDGEFVLPRVRPSANKLYEQYARSWVFDVDGGLGSARYQQLDSCSHADKCRDAAVAAVAAAEGRSGTSRSSGTERSQERGQTYTVADAKAARAAMANGGPSKAPRGKDHSRGLSKSQKEKAQQQKDYELERQRRERDRERERAAEYSSPPSGTSPDSPAVDSEESRSPVSAPSPEHGQEAAGLKPMVVVDAGSDRDSVSSRQRAHLQTFSRTPSPCASPAHSPFPGRPAAPTPGQVAAVGVKSPAPGQADPPIYECLERLAMQQRLQLSSPGGAASCQLSPRTTPSPRPLSAALSGALSGISGSLDESGSEQPQYTSLMSELTKAIRKKPATDETSSAEFCQKLEEALQEFQDLDSSTGGTLMNASSATSSTAPPPPVPDWGDSDSDDSTEGSTRTLSGKARSRSQPRLGRAFACPVPPPIMPMTTLQRRKQQEQEQQHGELATSPEPSFSLELENISQVHLSPDPATFSDRSREGESPSPPPPPPPPPVEEHIPSPMRSKTVVSICADGEMVVRELNNNEIVLRESPPPPPPPPPPPLNSTIPTPPLSPVDQGCSMGSVGRIGGLSLLRRGKNKRPAVRLSQELQDAVLQSESLVFLTDSELVARHERNRRVQREIEQRVQQQISGHTPSDSRC